MKILLVQPSQKNVYGASIKPSYVPLGLLYIGACLEKAGHVVDFVDLDIDGFSENKLLGYVNGTKPDLIGFGSTTVTINNVLKISGLIKNATDIPIIVGGIHATIAGEELIRNKNVDYVVVGEGEETIVELAETLANGQELSEVKGIYYKAGNEVVFTGDRALVKNLDNIPFPARHLLKHPTGYVPPDARKIPVASIMTSRGCAGRCTYCCTKLIFGRRMRFRTAKNITDEIEYKIKKYDIKEIHIMDDCFTINKKRVLEFRDEIKKRGIKTTFVFSNGIRADQVDEDILRALKDIGASTVAFGVESGNQMILDNIDKGLKLDTIRKAFRLSKKHGFTTWGFFMIGLPGENQRTVRDTIEFAKELDPDFAKFLILKPFPGTEVFRQLQREGRIFDFNYDNYGTYAEPVHDLPDLAKEEILSLQKKALKEFYLRPSHIFKTISRIHSLTQFKLNVKSALFVMRSMFKK